MITTINEWKMINEEGNFPSQFEIDDLVSFVPMVKDQETHYLSEDELEGRVVAVRFSKAKVFYDIVDEYYGYLFRDTDSCKVKPSFWTPVDDKDMLDKVEEKAIISWPSQQV